MNEVSLEKYVEKLIEAKMETVNARFAAMDKALSLAREETDRRMEQLNELRAQVVEDRGRFVTREIFDNVVKQFEASRGHQWRSTLALVVSIVVGLGVLIGVVAKP